MTYRAKKPRKHILRIRVQKTYYVSVEDENEEELMSDFVFGTREAAMNLGKKMLKEVAECSQERCV